MVMNGIEFNFVGKYNNGTLESGILFTYKGIKYKTYMFTYSRDITYSIGRGELFGSTMNIDKVTKQYVSLYSYDMMNQRTSYKMALSEMVFNIEE
jgi:hypothetical protein